MRKIYLLLFMAVIAMTQMTVSADAHKKREMRAVWLQSVWNGDWPTNRTATAATQKAELTSILDQLQAANINAVCLQVRSMCDALYKSSLEPTSYFLTGTRGKDASYDALEFFVTECHKRNMEAHAWINPMRLPTSLNTSLAFDKKVSDSNWMIAYSYTNASGSKVTENRLNIGKSTVRAHIGSVIAEIVKNYDIDGIIFDDYFYAEGTPLGSGYDFSSYTTYKNDQTAAGKTPLSQADWRRRNVRLMVKQCRDSIKAHKPYVRFGIGPAGVAGADASKYDLPACYAGNDWVYSGIYCAPLEWLNAGLIDYISPQVYWAQTHSTNPYQPIVKWWSEVAKKFERHLFVSQSSSAMTATELEAQIKINREENLTDEPGSIFFNTNSLIKKISAATSQFKYPAAVPEMTWYSNTKAPGTIKSLSLTSGKLKATSISNTRYIFYAVPVATSRKSALSTDHDGLKPTYILGVSYSNTFTVPEGKTTGYWYAVALLDRYGKEWDLVTLNEPASDPAPAPDLLYPENRYEFTGNDITLCVEANGSSSYSLEISTSSKFTTLAYTSTTYIKDTDGNLQFVFPASYLGDTGKFYWRIKVSKANYLDNYSATRNFVVAEKEPIGDYVPVTDGSVYQNVKASDQQIRLTSLWSRSDAHGNPLTFNCDFTASLLANNHRSMVVSPKDGIIYITDTQANKLMRFSAETGVQLPDLVLNLPAEYKCCHYPLNTVMTDDKGNILISGLKLADSTPLPLGKVDTETGDVTLIGRYTDVTKRVDHSGICGDVDGTLYFFAVESTGNVVHRWTIAGGSAKHETMTLSANTGYTPSIVPVSSKGFFIDSSTKGFEYYVWGTSTPKGKFADASAIAPAVLCDGGVYINYNGHKFLCYTATPGNSSGGTGTTFRLVSGSGLPDSYSGATALWDFPTNAGGLGTYLPTNDWCSPVAYLPPSDIKPAATISAPGKVIVFSPLNGLAAYNLDTLLPTGVEATPEDIAAAITVGTAEITLPVMAENIALYTLDGREISSVSSAASIPRPAISGVILLKAKTSAGVIAAKISL